MVQLMLMVIQFRVQYRQTSGTPLYGWIIICKLNTVLTDPNASHDVISLESAGTITIEARV